MDEERTNFAKLVLNAETPPQYLLRNFTHRLQQLKEAKDQYLMDRSTIPLKFVISHIQECAESCRQVSLGEAQTQQLSQTTTGADQLALSLSDEKESPKKILKNIQALIKSIEELLRSLA